LPHDTALEEKLQQCAHSLKSIAAKGLKQVAAMPHRWNVCLRCKTSVHIVT